MMKPSPGDGFRVNNHAEIALMARGNLARCLQITLVHEGRWSDHPADPGGATMKGVTMGRYRQYYPNATKDQLRNISNADLQRIYRDDYWVPVGGDSLPYGVDLATFDFGVNSGPSRGVRYLQAALGVSQTGRADAITLKEANDADGKATVQKICARRLSFVRALGTFRVFGKGWTRRIADIEAKGVAMWLSRGAPLTRENRDALREEGTAARDTARQQDRGAATTGGGGAVVGGGDAAVTGAFNGWVLLAIGVAVLCVVGYLVFKAHQNRARANAYEEVAAEPAPSEAKAGEATKGDLVTKVSQRQPKKRSPK